MYVMMGSWNIMPGRGSWSRRANFGRWEQKLRGFFMGGITRAKIEQWERILDAGGKSRVMFIMGGLSLSNLE